MAKHYDKQFKLDAIQYYHEHRELGLQGCASNLGISHQTLSRWPKELRDTGDIESRGSGNYASDLQMTTKNYTVDCNRTKSQWQVKMGKTSF